MRPIVLGIVLLVAVVNLPVRAAEDAATQAARWHDLRVAIFGDRAITDGAGVLTLEAPARALDAALVPISVTLADPPNVKALYIIIDANPSPLAGVFHFGPAADAHMLKTRVRVDQYTLMHAVAETADGHLFVAEQYVKAAGGCSAPSTKNRELAMARLGQMKLKAVSEGSDVNALQLLISHPNNNGMQMDQVTRNYVPARYIQDVKVTYGNDLVFQLDADISLSEDPAITFGLTPRGSAPITVEMHDSSTAVFKQSFDLTAARS
ncbi:MAG TPA: quinoprotein dehydrogenase-associated SoxYZ-like carrier [Alphaproteobacteria bacterium]|nr:quinoprotein dehydrogenase-associated SoxYZ-like carrier [Alphaproteobacteria bacterium]